MTHSEEIRLSESAEMKFDATFSYEDAKVLESKLRQDREDRRPFLDLSYQHAELYALGETLAVRERTPILSEFGLHWKAVIPHEKPHQTRIAIQVCHHMVSISLVR
jgi:hypothetical protein